jgi:O-antigen/teichoic acid export membrane protein
METLQRAIGQNTPLNWLRFIVVKNSLANMVRAGGSAVVALVLPHFLTQALDHDRFAAWALMLNIAAYANYLDFGIQTAIARYLAQAMERQDEALRDNVISTAFILLAAGGFVALTAIGVVLAFLPRIFQDAPISLIGELRSGTGILALSTAFLLPLSTFTGVLTGLCRNELSALAIGGSRLAGALLVIVAVQHTQSLIVLATLIGACNVAGGVAQYALVRKLMPSMQISWSRASRAAAFELAQYCSTLAVWGLCLGLVSGLDVVIVGHYDFNAVGAYSVAAVLVAFFTGANYAVSAALLAPIAVLQERGEWLRIRKLVISVTRLSTFFDTVAILLVFWFGAALLRRWVDESYAIQALPVLKILVIANAIRLLGAPFSAALVATNQQHFGISGAIAEGVSNLVCSVVGASAVGAIGVAWGTLIGAIISISWALLLTVRWLKKPILSRSELLVEGCLRPILCLSPMIVYTAVFSDLHTAFLRVCGVTLALLGTALITWLWGNMRLSPVMCTA